MTGHDANLGRALACAAIQPGLRSVLVVDASPQRLRAIAATFRELLERATGSPIALVPLAATTDDDLWGAHGFGDDGQPEWQPGILAPRQGSESLIHVRDLAALGLEAMRTLVTMVGADVAHLERNGHVERWRPPLAWIAGCSSSDAGKISPHLLDRFALRLDGAGELEAVAPTIARQELKAWLKRPAEETAGAVAATLHVPPTLAVETAAARACQSSDASLDEVLDILASAEGALPTLRRSIALARMSVAEGRFAGASTLRAAHVSRAARLMGLARHDAPEAAAEPPKTQARDEVTETEVPTEGSSTRQAHASASSSDARPSSAVVPGDARTSVALEDPCELAAATRRADQVDRAESNRERYSLAWPSMARRSSVRAARGAIVGTEQSQDLRDLAVSATFLQAAWHQAMRPRSRSGRLTLCASDLRRYRRIAPVERMLAMIIDYTSLAGWDWESAVLPYLRDAYAQRASACFVRVGHAAAESALRADKPMLARSVLAVDFPAIFEAAAGRATPLAHGLESALEELRHVLHHGRGPMVRAQLVVVTDGRGNLGLRHSRANAVTARIGDEGVRDALDVAQRIRMLDRLESIVLRPASCVSPSLPERLATAMGATLRKPAHRTERGDV